MSREDLSRGFPLIPSTNLTLLSNAKGPRDAEPKHLFITKLRRRVKELAPAGCIGVLRTREGRETLLL